MSATKLDPEKHRDAALRFLQLHREKQRGPSLAALGRIPRAFARLPYENLSKIIHFSQSRDLGVPEIRLPETVFAEHAEHKLGGACFSLTFFLQSILNAVGFACYPVMADMRAGRNVHCALVALLEGRRYLLDPGYLLTQPMELRQASMRHLEPHTGIELRYDRKADRYDLFTFDHRGSKWRYCFVDRPVAPETFLRHWLASFNGNGMRGLCLSKRIDGGLLFVNRTFMRETTFNGRHNFNIKHSFHATIYERFGIDAQVVEQAQAALALNRRPPAAGFPLDEQMRLSELTACSV